MVYAGGKREVLPSIFASDNELVHWLQNFAFSQGVRLDPIKPYSGGYLPEHNVRWHCLIPPVAVDGAVVSFRRHEFAALTLNDFDDPNNLCGECIEFVRGYKPLLVCGSTSSGKTTFLAALLRSVCQQERLAILESIVELPLLSSLWVRCQTQGDTSMEALIEEILRLRPDRFVIGEIRGQEILAFVKGMTIGHLGLLTTLHAESSKQVQARVRFLLSLYTSSFQPEMLGDSVHALILRRGNPPQLCDIAELNI